MYHLLPLYIKPYLPYPVTLLQCQAMARRELKDHQGTLNIRGIPKELVYRLKMAAAAEHRSVKVFLLALVEDRIQELERKGLLPKSK
jgi:hypothetical protein